jgi:uncharacterized SAM-binding protein YcdF (DUF218 family)
MGPMCFSLLKWVAPGPLAWARCVVLWLAGFTLLNLAMGWAGVSPSMNLWWIDLRFLPAWAEDGWLVLFAVSGVGLVFTPRVGWVRKLGLAAGWVTAGVVFWNACVVMGMHFSGKVTLWFGVPMSLVLFLGLGWAFWVLWGQRDSEAGWQASPGHPGQRVVAGAVAMMVLTVGFLLGEMAMFGQTTYQGKADAIVVLGARAYADGRPSDMLRDRVMTGIRLYQAGAAPRLVFTGGPGDGAFSEPEVMRAMALEAGVPEGAIVMDDQGVSTQASARNVAGILGKDERVMLVSHGYHLPRSRMLFHRAGLRTVSAPAEVRYVPSKLGVYLVREAVALVWYYFAGLGADRVGGGLGSDDGAVGDGKAAGDGKESLFFAVNTHRKRKIVLLPVLNVAYHLGTSPTPATDLPDVSFMVLLGLISR